MGFNNNTQFLAAVKHRAYKIITEFVRMNKPTKWHIYYPQMLQKTSLGRHKMIVLRDWLITDGFR